MDDQVKAQPRVYTCPRCGLSTTFRKDYIIHLKRVRPCSTRLSDVNPMVILQELQQEYNMKPFSCKKCKQRFTFATNMYRHATNCTGVSKQTEICPIENNQQNVQEDTDVEDTIAPNETAQVVAAYIYLIREREFVRMNEQVYKHGKTRSRTVSLNVDRWRAYKKGSELILIKKVPVDHVDVIERKVTRTFSLHFERHPDGLEYYIGDPEEMTRIIDNVIADHINESNNLSWTNESSGSKIRFSFFCLQKKPFLRTCKLYKQYVHYTCVHIEPPWTTKATSMQSS